MAPWAGEDLVLSATGQLVCSPGSGQELMTPRRALPGQDFALTLGRCECCLGHPAFVVVSRALHGDPEQQGYCLWVGSWCEKLV